MVENIRKLARETLEVAYCQKHENEIPVIQVERVLYEFRHLEKFTRINEGVLAENVLRDARFVKVFDLTEHYQNMGVAEDED